MSKAYLTCWAFLSDQYVAIGVCFCIRSTIFLCQKHIWLVGLFCNKYLLQTNFCCVITTFVFYSKPFVSIGNFFVPYKNFQASLKPRAWMDNEVMSLFVEKFNIENQLKTSTNKRLRKKFAFSVHMTVSNCFSMLSMLTIFCCCCTFHVLMSTCLKPSWNWWRTLLSSIHKKLCWSSKMLVTDSVYLISPKLKSSW